MREDIQKILTAEIESQVERVARLFEGKEELTLLATAAFERQPREDYRGLVKRSLSEFRGKVEREVDEMLAALRAWTDETCEIPWIGGSYPPHAPQEQLVPLKQRIVRARCCQHLFEFEAPRWAHPLPVRLKDCQALYNQPNRRLVPVGRYGQLLRSMDWQYQRVRPFVDYYAEYCAPP